MSFPSQLCFIFVKSLCSDSNRKRFHSWLQVGSRHWRHQNRGPEGSGAGLEAFWAIFGYPGCFWKRLGSSWKRLGASWRPPGPFWAEKGGQRDSKLAPKTEPKSIKNRFRDRSLVWCHLESSFFRCFFDLGNQEPSHVGSKMHSKIDFTLTNPESPKLL